MTGDHPGGGGNTSGSSNASGTSGNGSSSGQSSSSGSSAPASGSASGGGSGSSNNNPGSGSGSGSSSSGSAIGSDSGSGSSSGSSASGSTSPPPAMVDGCAVASGKAKLYQVPDDTAAAGPWPVGVKTLLIPGMKGGTRPVEVWYPAPIGSNSTTPKVTYNLSSWLPGGVDGAQAKMIPASANAPQSCDCYRDFPLDTSMGPYPAVIFLHGTGSFRTASLSAMTQWASRGFIVVAADHAGLYLADFLITASLGSCTTGGSGVSYGSQDLNGDVDVMRLVGITNGNHLDVIDLCVDTNMATPPQTGIEVATKYNVCGASVLSGLAKCGTVMPVTAGPEIVKYATTAALEETLHCANRDAAFSMLTTKYPQVSATNYQHSP